MLVKNKLTGLVSIVFLGLFALICLIIACNDFLCYKIPNQLLIALVILFVIRNILYFDFTSLLHPSLWAAITLGIGFVLYLVKIMGAGDAKLLAVSTLWMADYNLLHFYGYVALSGGVLAIIYFFMHKTIYIWRHRLLDRIEKWPANRFLHKIMVLPTADNVLQAGHQHPVDELKALPYGVPIFIAALISISHKLALGNYQ